MRPVGIIILVIAAALASSGLRAAELDPPPPTRADAIELARNGKFDEALKILASLREESPVDPAIVYDEIVVQAWAGQHQAAVDNTRLIDFKLAPTYMVRAVARSARNVRNYNRAGSWYSLLLERDVTDIDARRGLAMTMSDADRHEEAWAALDSAPDEQADEIILILTGAYLYERERRFLEALLSYQRVVELEPGNTAALRGEAVSLRAVLLPRQALALAREHPGILTDEELLHLEADVAAIQIRYGAQSYYPDSRRYEGTDVALTQVDELLARSDLEPEMRLRLRYDRIVALTNRLNTAEAIEEFESLDVAADQLPSYVLASVGRAYLNEHRPLEARDVLEMAVASEPGNFHIKFQLFFAYTDLREAGKAIELAEELLATLPETNQLPGSRVIKGNDDYLRAAIMFGLARAYFDQLAYSQRYFEVLLAKAPHNTDIRHELANVYRWRGWLDRSASEYEQVLAVEPDMMSARVGRAHVRLDKREYATAALDVEALSEQYGEEPAVKNLADRWQVHNRQEIVVDAEAGESSGPTFGDDQYRVDVSWFSKPLAHWYRATVFTHDDYAGFPEGSGRRQRIGAGVEYSYRRWLASARVSGSRDGGEVGIRAEANYRFSDHWNFGALAETESNATPLRGYRVGVSSNLLGVSAIYTFSESADIRAKFDFQDFSDGNAGNSLSIRGQQRLFNQPNFRLAAIGEAFSANRDRSDVPYFSPKSSFSWSAGLRFDWLMTRRYDFALTHTITGQMGRHKQSGFEKDGIWSLHYEFRADLSNSLSTHLGLNRRRNVYDGELEYSTFIIGGLRWRF
jgi:biofilm PGA synthesis protein PgaA